MLTILIIVLLTMAYLLLMVAYSRGWRQQKDFVPPEGYEPSIFISVIIAARNERENIRACIASVLAQQYPAGLLEVIVVDDHSEDGTGDIVKEYAGKNVRCIHLADHLGNGKKINAYKKAAIAAGINGSKGTLIVTTDADCTAPETWLMNIAAIYEQQRPAMIVGPVTYDINNSLLHIFQLTDFMGMQGITAAAHSLKMGNMSNGANLAFTKAAYRHVGGYDGIEHLASGDDYLLMMKMSKSSPQGIAYLKTPAAIVSTTPQPNWGGFLQQRIRWASKSGKYNDGKLTGILLLVYLFNCSFLILAIAGFYQPGFFYVLACMLLIKIIAEYMFLVPVARFFGKRRVLHYFPILQPLHILYIILAGFLGFIGVYKWKGRRVR